MANKEVRSPGSGERDSDFRDLVTRGLDGDGLPITSRIEAKGNVLDEPPDVRRIGAPLNLWVLCIRPASTW